jgi:hypothetical protein
MKRERRPGRTDSTARLVGRSANDVACYWYFGAGDGHLAEQASVTTEAEAVAWGRARSNRVQLRSVDGCTYWAGSDTRPYGIDHEYGDAPPAAAMQ